MLTYTGPIRSYQPSHDYEAIQGYVDNLARDGYENLGSGDNEVFDTGSTSRKINAQGGHDEIILGSGHDTVYGGTGDDTIYLGTGNNTAFGGSNNDYLLAGRGADVLYGGSGDDELWGDNDGSFSTVTGTDQLFGGSGNDKLIGHTAADEMTGGSGADTFIYRAANESTNAARDHILDFNRAEGDKIDFSFLDGNPSQAGNQAFDFEPPTGQAGQVWAEGSGTEWTVFADVNGGGADIVITVTLAGGATSLVESDFIL